VFEQRGGEHAPPIYASARVYSGGGGRECWSRSGPGQLEGADAAQARYASAHHCHNDFITNQGALGGDYRVGGAVELGAGVVRSCALKRMDGGGGVFIIISIRSSPSPPVNARPFLSRSRGRLLHARTHTHTHTQNIESRIRLPSTAVRVLTYSCMTIYIVIIIKYRDTHNKIIIIE